MRIADIMTASIVRLRPETKVREALRVMLEHHVDGAPVVNHQNRLVGILTFADLLRYGRRQHPQAVDFFLFAMVINDEDAAVRQRFDQILNQPVQQICTPEVVVCGPDDDVADVAGLMVDHRIHRVPVVSAHGTLIGIVSRGDLVRAIWSDHDQRPS